MIAGMHLFLLVALLMADPPCTKKVCVETIDQDETVTFYAVSRIDGISIVLTLDSTNMQPHPRVTARPLRRGRTKLLTVDAVPNKEWSYEYEYNWEWGTFGAKHDERAEYRLPFASGWKVKLFQGPYGASSHRDKAAYDFPSPRGTPVVAARGGQVVWVVDEHGEGGFDMKYWDLVNQVGILHADGTIAMYLHLLRGGMKVKLDDRVNAGDVIGTVGNSGYSSAPHLHFEVFRLTGEKLQHETISVRFATAEGKRLSLQEGKWYRAP